MRADYWSQVRAVARAAVKQKVRCVINSRFSPPRPLLTPPHTNLSSLTAQQPIWRYFTLIDQPLRQTVNGIHEQLRNVKFETALKFMLFPVAVALFCFVILKRKL